ncbi:beta-ketoacyl-ACP reductase [Candidatus Micrarchaeota archaeon]|nr:beta-ketoacyl-ACP reductase [Candidatus Micrarchaeota archaeon]
MPPNFLKNKTVIVTGGSRGIGAAIVRAAMQSGAKVAFSYRKSTEEAGALEKEGAIAIQTDMNDEPKVKEFISQATEKLGRIDVLVNNVGITQDSAFSNMTSDKWEEVIKTNLTSAFYSTKAALEKMNDSGRIINISSIVGMDGNFGQTNYAASKAGLIGFTKSLAKELAARKITVNAIAPGFTETDMVKKIPESIQASLKQKIPLGRFGKPEEIAAFVIFLASDYAAYTTGNVFRVDGGYTL